VANLSLVQQIQGAVAPMIEAIGAKIIAGTATATDFQNIVNYLAVYNQCANFIQGAGL
jgi:hypothetical protein